MDESSITDPLPDAAHALVVVLEAVAPLLDALALLLAVAHGCCGFSVFRVLAAPARIASSSIVGRASGAPAAALRSANAAPWVGRRERLWRCWLRRDPSRRLSQTPQPKTSPREEEGEARQGEETSCTCRIRSNGTGD